MKLRSQSAASLFAVTAFFAPAHAATIVDTGLPDGRIAMRSGGQAGTETADDFSLDNNSSISSGSFTGLITGDIVNAASITDIELSIFRIFPANSAPPPDGDVPTRVNSPADNSLFSARSALSQISFTANLLSGNFLAGNSVEDGGIHEFPNQRTGGNGAIAGHEVQINFTLNSSFALDAGHYFFVPIVTVANGGAFYWLSTQKPSSPDLEAWTRDSTLSPDWLRVGTDIVGAGETYNASFSLISASADTSVPEPASWVMLATGFAAIGGTMRGRRRVRRSRECD